MFIKKKPFRSPKKNIPATNAEKSSPDVIPVIANNALSIARIISVDSPPIIANFANWMAFGNIS